MDLGSATRRTRVNRLRARDAPRRPQGTGDLNRNASSSSNNSASYFQYIPLPPSMPTPRTQSAPLPSLPPPPAAQSTPLQPPRRAITNDPWVWVDTPEESGPLVSNPSVAGSDRFSYGNNPSPYQRIPPSMFSWSSRRTPILTTGNLRILDRLTGAMSSRHSDSAPSERTFSFSMLPRLLTFPRAFPIFASGQVQAEDDMRPPKLRKLRH
jgi:hypothetical protein